MTRRAAKVDLNQSQIVEELRGIPGVSVALTHTLGRGYPDIVVGWRGLNFLFEIKQPGREDDLTEDEVRFHREWAGQVSVVSSSSEIWDIMVRLSCYNP